MPHRYLVPFLLAFVLSLCMTEAKAIDSWNVAGCDNTNQVGDATLACYDFNSSSVLNTVKTFRVNASQAQACFDPDKAALAKPASPGTVKIQYCGTNPTTLTAAGCGIEVCAPAGCTLDGTNGTPASQLSCITLGRGSYIMQITTLPGAGPTAVFSIQGGD